MKNRAKNPTTDRQNPPRQDRSDGNPIEGLYSTIAPFPPTKEADKEGLGGGGDVGGGRMGGLVISDTPTHTHSHTPPNQQHNAHVQKYDTGHKNTFIDMANLLNSS